MRAENKKKPKKQARLANRKSKARRGQFVLSYTERKQLRFIRDQLINSRGAVCGICGKEIKDMRQCTVDHIIPLSRGGMTTIENCQLAHFGCNQEKGNQIYGH